MSCVASDRDQASLTFVLESTGSVTSIIEGIWSEILLCLLVVGIIWGLPIWTLTDSFTSVCARTHRPMHMCMYLFLCWFPSGFTSQADKVEKHVVLQSESR